MINFHWKNIGIYHSRRYIRPHSFCGIWPLSGYNVPDTWRHWRQPALAPDAARLVYTFQPIKLSTLKCDIFLTLPFIMYSYCLFYEVSQCKKELASHIFDLALLAASNLSLIYKGQNFASIGAFFLDEDTSKYVIYLIP